MKRLLSIVAVCLVLGWGLFGPRGLELHQRVLIQAIGGTSPAGAHPGHRHR